MNAMQNVVTSKWSLLTLVVAVIVVIVVVVDISVVVLGFYCVL